MLQMIVEVIGGFIVECLISILWWLVLFPVVWLVSLPFIFVIALFRQRPYGYAVAYMLTNVHLFWRERGLLFTP